MLGNGDDANTGPVFAMLRREIIDRMQWDQRRKLSQQAAPERLKREVIGTYKGLLYDLGLEYRIEEQDGQLWVVSEFFNQFLGRDRSAMHYLGENSFAIADYPNWLRFDCDAAGTPCDIALYRPGSDAAPFVRTMAEIKQEPD